MMKKVNIKTLLRLALFRFSAFGNGIQHLDAPDLRLKTLFT
jgi:hypothetical protein